MNYLNRKQLCIAGGPASEYESTEGTYLTLASWRLLGTLGRADWPGATKSCGYLATSTWVRRALVDPPKTRMQLRYQPSNTICIEAK